MGRFAAFLRAINVGGRRVTKDELIAIAHSAGCRDVSTWRASGNLLLTSDVADTGMLESRLEEALHDGLGYSVAVLIRSSARLAEVASTEPFDGLAGRGKHQVVFLRTEPTEAQLQAFLAHLGPNEVVHLAGTEIHWSPSGGVSDSEFDMAKVERILSPTTMRTMNTVEEIASRLT